MARPGEAAKYNDLFPGDNARADTVASIAALDEAVGRILDKLQTTGLDQKTVVFFVGDNGGHPENRSENLPLRVTNGPFTKGAFAFLFWRPIPVCFRRASSIPSP